MYKLYEYLKALDRPPTPDELQVAANVIPLESQSGKTVLKDMNAKEGPLIAMFDRQNKKEVSVIAGILRLHTHTHLLAECLGVQGVGTAFAPLTGFM
ncbi:MAG TPA: hypothetical protein VGO47_05655 [Chlamydiales bacterium]|nr:hypothetical protein [Chlamydiales bacterium]